MVADVPQGTEITQVPATLLALHGLKAPLDAAAVEAILDPGIPGARREAGVVPQRLPSNAPDIRAKEEDLIVRRLRDLGYE